MGRWLELSWLMGGIIVWSDESSPNLFFPQQHTPSGNYNLCYSFILSSTNSGFALNLEVAHQPWNTCLDVFPQHPLIITKKVSFTPYFSLKRTFLKPTRWCFALSQIDLVCSWGKYQEGGCLTIYRVLNDSCWYYTHHTDPEWRFVWTHTHTQSYTE